MIIFLRLGQISLVVAALCAIGIVVDGDLLPTDESTLCRTGTRCASPLDIIPIVGAATFGLMGIVFALVGWLGSRNERLVARLRADGQQATATVTQVRATSSRVGSSPVLRLDFDLHSSVHGTTAGSRRMLVPAHLVPHVQPGAKVPALIDPARPDRYALLLDELG